MKNSVDAHNFADKGGYAVGAEIATEMGQTTAQAQAGGQATTGLVVGMPEPYTPPGVHVGTPVGMVPVPPERAEEYPEGWMPKEAVAKPGPQPVTDVFTPPPHIKVPEGYVYTPWGPLSFAHKSTPLAQQVLEAKGLAEQLAAKGVTPEGQLVALSAMGFSVPFHAKGKDYGYKTGTVPTAEQAKQAIKDFLTLFPHIEQTDRSIDVKIADMLKTKEGQMMLGYFIQGMQKGGHATPSPGWLQTLGLAPPESVPGSPHFTGAPYSVPKIEAERAWQNLANRAISLIEHFGYKQALKDIMEGRIPGVDKNQAVLGAANIADAQRAFLVSLLQDVNAGKLSKEVVGRFMEGLTKHKGDWVKAAKDMGLDVSRYDYYHKTHLELFGKAQFDYLVKQGVIPEGSKYLGVVNRGTEYEGIQYQPPAKPLTPLAGKLITPVAPELMPPGAPRGGLPGLIPRPFEHLPRVRPIDLGSLFGPLVGTAYAAGPVPTAVAKTVKVVDPWRLEQLREDVEMVRERAALPPVVESPLARALRTPEGRADIWREIITLGTAVTPTFDYPALRERFGKEYDETVARWTAGKFTEEERAEIVKQANEAYDKALRELKPGERLELTRGEFVERALKEAKPAETKEEFVSRAISEAEKSAPTPGEVWREFGISMIPIYSTVRLAQMGAPAWQVGLSALADVAMVVPIVGWAGAAAMRVPLVGAKGLTTGARVAGVGRTGLELGKEFAVGLAKLPIEMVKHPGEVFKGYGKAFVTAFKPEAWRALGEVAVGKRAIPATQKVEYGAFRLITEPTTRPSPADVTERLMLPPRPADVTERLMLPPPKGFGERIVIGPNGAGRLYVPRDLFEPKPTQRPGVIPGVVETPERVIVPIVEPVQPGTFPIVPRVAPRQPVVIPREAPRPAVVPAILPRPVRVTPKPVIPPRPVPVTPPGPLIVTPPKRVPAKVIPPIPKTVRVPAIVSPPKPMLTTVPTPKPTPKLPSLVTTPKPPGPPSPPRVPPKLPVLPRLTGGVGLGGGGVKGGRGLLARFRKRGWLLPGLVAYFPEPFKPGHIKIPVVERRVIPYGAKKLEG